MRIAALVSGGGSNFQALLNATRRGRIPGKFVAVISSRPDARALERARKARVPTLVLEPKRFSRREEHDQVLAEVLNQANVDLVCLAGYVVLLTPTFFRRFRKPIMNVHPSLLPAFGGKGMYGRRIHEAVIESGVKVSGCTVHFVDQGFDTGPIILQHPVTVRESDTADTLASQILEWEHRLYPEAVRLFARHRLRVVGRKVHIR